MSRVVFRSLPAIIIVALTFAEPALAFAAALASVRGVAIDAAGKAVAGATVRLDGTAHAAATTQRDGSFSVAVPAGTYRVTISAFGFAPLTLRNVAVSESGLSLGRLALSPSLAELKVIGSAVARERLPFNSTPASVKVFPREAYRDQGQAAVSTVLDQTPGATVAMPAGQNAAQPQAPYVATVRGGLPFETALSLDGNPISVPLNYIPSFVLQDVEIVKGYGSLETAIPNAIDGAINLRTAEPGTLRKAQFEVEADSHGGEFSDLAYGGASPGARFSFATMFAVDGNPGPPAGVPAAGEALQRAELVKLRYQLSGATTLTGTYLGSQGTLGLGVTRGFDESGAFASLANSADAVESHRFGIYSLELHSDAGLDHVSARAFASQLQRSNSYDAFVFPSVGSGLNELESSSGISIQDDRQIAGNLYQLEFAHRNRWSQADSFIPAGARSDDTTFRAAALVHPGKKVDVQLAAAELALRERYSNDNGATFRDATLWMPVIHAGIAVRVKPNLTVRGALGTGAAAPPAAAVNSDPSVLHNQTPLGLAPYTFVQGAASSITLESSFGFDAGVEYRLHGDTTTLSADIYRIATHGAYTDAQTSTAPVLQFEWLNAPAMTHEGVELAVQQFKRVGLGFIAQASFLRTFVNGDGANLSGTLPPLGTYAIAPLRVPYAQAYGEISYKWPRGSRLSLGALYYGANNPFGRPAFAQLNSNLELSIGALSKFQLSVQNLTNAYAQALPPFFGAGVAGPRTIRIMFRQSIGPGTLFER